MQEYNLLRLSKSADWVSHIFYKAEHSNVESGGEGCSVLQHRCGHTGHGEAASRFRTDYASERTIECLTRLRWWRYSIFDLFGLPLGRIDEALDGIEEKLARGELKK
jgi:hypothetical protein